MSRRVHDAVAAGYNSGSGIIAEKNEQAAARLATRMAGRTGPLAVVDLGVGDGAMLAQLAARGLPLAMTGLDVSPAMLRRAAATVPLTVVEGSAERALDVLPAGAFDLVLAHFILAYVDAAPLLRQVRGLLAPGGVLSLVTTTGEGSAPFFEGLERIFRASRHPLKRLITHACDLALARCTAPMTYGDIEAAIHAAGLAVQRRDTLRWQVTFADAAEAYRFGIEEGWAANFLAVPWIPLRLAQALARWGTRQAAYPFTFTHVIEMLEIGRAEPAVAATQDRSSGLPAESAAEAVR